MHVLKVVTGLGLLGLCACSHLVQETRQPVQIVSEPAGAQVWIDGHAQTGDTPMTVYLDPRREYQVTVEKPCYQMGTRTLQPSMGLRTYGTVQIPVSQLDSSVSVSLRQTCHVTVNREGR